MRLKRLAAPRSWPIARKTKKRFVLHLAPGPHGGEALPLGVIIRDMLRYVDNIRELKLLLRSRTVTVDGRVRRSPNFPVGLMDVLGIGTEYYRLLPFRAGLRLHSISADEANIKPLKIVRKCFIRGNRQQIGGHDGRTLLVQDPSLKTGDVLIYDLKQGKIKEVIKFAPGATALITNGKNTGLVGVLEELTITKGPQPNRVRLRVDQRSVETLKDYVFVIGQPGQKPAISLGV